MTLGSGGKPGDEYCRKPGIGDRRRILLIRFVRRCLFQAFTIAFLLSFQSHLTSSFNDSTVTVPPPGGSGGGASGDEAGNLDTDHDLYSDAEEINAGTDPALAAEYPETCGDERDNDADGTIDEDCEPAFYVIFEDGTSAAYSAEDETAGALRRFRRAELDADIEQLGSNEWELRLTAKSKAVDKVYFPWETNRYTLSECRVDVDYGGDGIVDDADHASCLREQIADDITYYPYLFGIARKADLLGPWAWSGLLYPGLAYAPLVVLADGSKAKITAALNWPPKKVTPLWSLGRMTLLYEEKISPSQTASYKALVAELEGDASLGNHPWQIVLDLYKSWLIRNMTAESLYPIAYPDWMKHIHGWQNIQLQNIYNENLDGTPDVNGLILDDSIRYTPGENIFDLQEHVTDRWERWKTIFPWVQFWGQMCDYREGEYPDTPLACTYGREIHERYLDSGLVSFADSVSLENGHVGYYSIPLGDANSVDRNLFVYYPLDDFTAAYPLINETGADETAMEYVTEWLRRNREDYGANAFYLDVVGARYFGDPLFAAKLFTDGTFPKDAVIEYPVDIYPAALLVSGSLNGGSVQGGPGRTPARLAPDDPATEVNEASTTFPNFGRYLLGDRIIFLGESNGDHRFWGPDLDPALVSDAPYWAERQAFLLGAKLDAIRIADDSANPGAMNPALALIIAEREAVNWWAREPVYWDTKGIANIPAGIEARRFVDRDGRDLLVLDNWRSQSGLSLTFLGEPVDIPSNQLSILDLSDTAGGGLPLSFTIAASAGSGGTISPKGQVSVAGGGDQTFTVTPNLGYETSEILVDGEPAALGSSYPFTNVTQDHTIAASFEPDASPFTITITSPETDSSTDTSNVSAAIETSKVLQIVSIYLNRDQAASLTPSSFPDPKRFQYSSPLEEGLNEIWAAGTDFAGVTETSNIVFVNYSPQNLPPGNQDGGNDSNRDSPSGGGFIASGGVLVFTNPSEAGTHETSGDGSITDPAKSPRAGDMSGMLSASRGGSFSTGRGPSALRGEGADGTGGDFEIREAVIWMTGAGSIGAGAGLIHPATVTSAILPDIELNPARDEKIRAFQQRSFELARESRADKKAERRVGRILSWIQEVVDGALDLARRMIDRWLARR